MRNPLRRRDDRPTAGQYTIARRSCLATIMVAIRRDPNVNAFYEKLVAKGKMKMPSIVVVMRKLLQAIHGMLRTDTDFAGEKFFAMEG